MEIKFYRCPHCGNIIVKVKDSGVPVMCCGQKMEEVPVNTNDGAHEKHVPVIERNGNVVEVKVGGVDHPMLDNHYIEWILLATNKGNQRKTLKPGDAPKATFYVGDDEVVEAAYELCNLHGLYKA